jgi:hypothetical protein
MLAPGSVRSKEETVTTNRPARRSIPAFAACAVILGGAAGALGAGYTLAWSSTLGASSASSGPRYGVSATAGSPVAAGPTGASPGGYSLAPGFQGAAFTRCKADFNGQNGVDLLDIFAFLNAWFAGCTGAGTPGPACRGSADYNGAGGVELLDIFAFLHDWFSGC